MLSNYFLYFISIQNNYPNIKIYKKPSKKAQRKCIQRFIIARKNKNKRFETKQFVNVKLFVRSNSSRK